MSETFQLNKAAILELLAGDEELFVSMTQVFLEEADSYCEQLSAALGRRDLAVLRREAHTLKSLMASFADEPGRLLAQEIEQQAKQNREDDLPVLAEQSQRLVARVRLLCAALNKELANSA